MGIFCSPTPHPQTSGRAHGSAERGRWKKRIRRLLQAALAVGTVLDTRDIQRVECRGHRFLKSWSIQAQRPQAPLSESSIRHAVEFLGRGNAARTLRPGACPRDIHRHGGSSEPARAPALLSVHTPSGHGWYTESGRQRGPRRGRYPPEAIRPTQGTPALDRAFPLQSASGPPTKHPTRTTRGTGSALSIAAACAMAARLLGTYLLQSLGTPAEGAHIF